MIPIYSQVISAIKKVHQNLMEEYQGIGKFLQDLVEGQEKNIAQFSLIRAMVKQMQCFKEDILDNDEENKEDGDNEEGFEESQREVEERTLLSTFYQNRILFLYYFEFIFLDCCIYIV